MNGDRPILTFLLMLGAVGGGGAVHGAGAERRADFNRDIRQVLSENCLPCHGPDEKARKSGLRLDVRDEVIRPTKSGVTPIVPGDTARSEVVRRITTSDPDDHMPPPESGKKLTQAQIDLLERWIREGAEYRDHWAFIPPERPPVPEVSNAKARIENPIDAFVVDGLAQSDLRQSPPADRPTLIRRVTLDLTGLPPTPDEVDAFLADGSPRAYDKLVDRLLDSPRFGERLALDWLDAARYADTHGYHLDSGRDMTAWRDWVIRAFNNDKPFDQFTVEQIAGDLLPNPTRDQRIATGFNRNHMINFEGGAIPEEYAFAYLVDRVNTTATVWMGLTVACAECHDHKFDPVKQKDYYRLMAFFNNVPEKGLDGSKGNAAPVLKLPTPEQDKQLATLEDGLGSAEERLKAALPEIDKAQARWEHDFASASPPQWVSLDPESLRTAGGATVERLEDHTLRLRGANPDRDTYTVAFQNPLENATAIRVEALADESLPEHGPGRASNGNFLLTHARLTAGDQVVTWKDASADFSQDGYPAKAVIDDQPESGWAVDGAIGKAHAIVLTFDAPATRGPMSLVLDFQGPYGQHGFGRVRLSITDAERPAVNGPLPERIRGLLAKAAPDRVEKDDAALRNYFREHVSSEYQRLEDAVASARKERDALDERIPSTMVMEEMETPRDTFIHTRGQYDKLGEQVTPGVPAFLPELAPGDPVNRLGLARWLVSPANPLTARVIVNRFWQMYFGTGLVKTSEDFGSQGEYPSHPELLDWLAHEFIESGWDVKHMQRLIVTSATYRQSSRLTPADAEADPENRLLSRGPRFRLQAEFIRDQALAISGLLNDRIGGQSVFPYQPAGLWSELSMREDSKRFSAQSFVQSTGPDLYRRSMYTFWKRSSPPPQLSTFDAPSRETCTVRRPRTNTPLQALILLNDPTYIESSRKLAERLLREADTDLDRIRQGFRLATSRFPNPSEEAVLLRILDQQRGHYRTRADAAKSLLANGDSPVDSDIGPAEMAAWTMVCSTLLNLDETLTRG